MSNNMKSNPGVGIVVLLLLLINALIAKVAFIKNENLSWLLVITVPLLLLAIFGGRQKKTEAATNPDGETFDRSQRPGIFQRTKTKKPMIAPYQHRAVQES